MLETLPTNANVPPGVNVFAGMKCTWSPATFKSMQRLMVSQVQNFRLGVLPKLFFSGVADIALGSVLTIA